MFSGLQKVWFVNAVYSFFIIIIILLSTNEIDNPGL